MWCEKITIDCSEMSIFMKHATQEIRVSDNIHFILEIEMYPLFTYYQQYFKNKTGNVVWISFNPILNLNILFNELQLHLF